VYLYLSNTYENRVNLFIRFGNAEETLENGKTISFNTDDNTWRVMASNELVLSPKRSTIFDIDRIITIFNVLTKQKI